MVVQEGNFGKMLGAPPRENCRLDAELRRGRKQVINKEIKRPSITS